MRRGICWLLLVFPAATLPWAARPVRNEAMATASRERVRLWVAFQKKHGTPAGNVTTKDFKIYEDGKPLTGVSVAPASSQPLTLGLLIQESGQRRDTLPHAETAPAAAFFRSMFRPSDIGFVGRYSFGVIATVVPLEREVGQIEKGIESTRHDKLGGRSDLYDAIVWACDQEKAARAGWRRALVIVSDGHDNASKHSKDDAIESALRSGTEIYFVDLVYVNQSLSRFPEDRYGLARLVRSMVKKTGGVAVFVHNRKDLAPAFARIAETLHEQYAVEFPLRSERRNRPFHKVKLKHLRSGLHAVAPAGFYDSRH